MFGTDGGADPTPLTVVQVDDDPPRRLITGDTEIGTKKAADLAGLAPLGYKAPFRLFDGLLWGQILVGKTRPRGQAARRGL